MHWLVRAMWGADTGRLGTSLTVRVRNDYTLGRLIDNVEEHPRGNPNDEPAKEVVTVSRTLFLLFGCTVQTLVCQNVPDVQNLCKCS